MKEIPLGSGKFLRYLSKVMVTVATDEILLTFGQKRMKALLDHLTTNFIVGIFHFPRVRKQPPLRHHLPLYDPHCELFRRRDGGVPTAVIAKVQRRLLQRPHRVFDVVGVIDSGGRMPAVMIMA